MENINKNLKSIKTRKPWGRPLPSDLSFANVLNDEDSVAYAPYTQADMLREFYPSSHKINSQKYYPDIYTYEEVEDPDTHKMVKKYYCHHVPRKAYAFQQIIAIKRTMHLTGNDTQFEHVDATEDNMSEAYKVFCQGWAQKDMDTYFGAAVFSTMVVADAAIVYYMDKGQVKTRNLSYMSGDTLYIHYERDGRIKKLFVRSFSSYDDEGDEVANYLEIWDKNTYYLYRKKGRKVQSPIRNFIESAVLKLFNLDSYECIECEPHGFGQVPVAYHRREDGSSWIHSQDTIEAFELAKSQMAQNNEEYGEPAVVIVSEDEAIGTARDVRGTIREYHISQGDDVKMLQAQSAAESYMKETDADEKLIYKQSFCVDTPEMKSGDLPAQALKIMYSLAFEMASIEALQYQDFLRQCVELFAIGYGIEMKMSLDFKELMNHIRYWIEPYVHESTSSVVNDLAVGVQNKFISRKTAANYMRGRYTSPDEWEQIQKEEHEADNADLLQQIKMIKAQARINKDNQNQAE